MMKPIWEMFLGLASVVPVCDEDGVSYGSTCGSLSKTDAVRSLELIPQRARKEPIRKRLGRIGSAKS
jgi:hypothetical protein